jgi:hypothetical protein
MRMSCSFVFNLFLLRSTTAFAPAARSPWTTTAAAARASGTALRATASENWQIRLMEAYEEAEVSGSLCIRRRRERERREWEYVCPL